jgi:hypothetical protein
MVRILNLGSVGGVGIATGVSPTASFSRATKDVEGVDRDWESYYVSNIRELRLLPEGIKVAASMPFIKRVTQSLRASVKKEECIISAVSAFRRNTSRSSSSERDGRVSSIMALSSSVSNAEK